MHIPSYLLFSSLLLVAIQVKGEDYDNELPDLDVQVGPWNPSKEDTEAVMRTYRQYAIARSSPVGAGKHIVGSNQTFLITSPSFPSPYPGGQKIKWIFAPDTGVFLTVECPNIRIQSSRGCANDHLTVFVGKRFRRGVRRCGMIDNYSREVFGSVKLVFKSNTDNKQGIGFFCRITGNLIPTTTPTPTTHSPGCPELLQPNSPTPVSNCSQLNSNHSSHCQCSECNGEIFLKCDFCTYCDFNIFALHTFPTNLVLGASFTCAQPLDLTSLFHSTASQVVGLRLCVEQDRSHVTMPFSMFTNLNGLYYQDCSNTTTRACVYDPCTTTDVCTTIPGRRRSLSHSTTRTVTTYPVTLPSPSDVPFLTELYLAEVKVTLNQSVLAYAGLEKVCMNAEDGHVTPNAFNSLTSVKQVYVEMCQADLENADFAMQSSSLDCLEIVDHCTHNIQDHAISLDAGCNPNNTTIIVTANKDFIPVIPRCPFYTLMQTNCVQLKWVTQTDCRQCMGYWLWGLTSSQLSKITNQCYDAVMSTEKSLATHVSNNALSSMCNFPLTPC